VGLLAVALDALTYRLMITMLITPWAKGLSFLAGAGFAYVANKWFTFQARRVSVGEGLRFGLFYACTLALNVAVNGWVLRQWPEGFWVISAPVAGFLVATGCSTVVNFLGQKYVVFTSPPSPPGSPVEVV
jgi:putative flippase GtrA